MKLCLLLLLCSSLEATPVAVSFVSAHSLEIDGVTVNAATYHGVPAGPGEQWQADVWGLSDVPSSLVEYYLNLQASYIAEHPGVDPAALRYVIPVGPFPVRWHIVPVYVAEMAAPEPQTWVLGAWSLAGFLFFRRIAFARRR